MAKKEANEKSREGLIIKKAKQAQEQSDMLNDFKKQQ